MAVGGVVANTYFIYLAADAVDEAHWGYFALARNPKAFGREIAPATIASLRQPLFLWFASTALIISSVFGLMLAIHLVRSVLQMDRAPDTDWRGITRYRRIKPYAIAVTATAFFCFGLAHHAFWVTATRHTPVGSMSPVSELLESALLALCGLIPWWWIGRSMD